MADSSPNHRRPGSSSKEVESSRDSKTEVSAPIVPTSPTSPSASRASVPPSEPRSTSRTSFSQLDVGADRPARLQMIVALVLGLVLVAIPLYLWRRPRAESIAVGSATDAGAEPVSSGAPSSPSPSDAKPTLTDAKVLQCNDPGSKKTSPEQCDHVVEVEKAFAKAIEDSASCVPSDAGGGTIQYVADVSWKRKAVNIAAPKDTRTMKNAKVVAACQSAVKSRLSGLALEGIAHGHARYKVAITATYVGGVK